MIRSLLLRMSRSPALQAWVPRQRFARRAVRRFMPGETLDDALDAARRLQDQGLGIVFTELGENVATADDAAAVARRYVEALDRIQELGLDADVSVKPTHLGLDLDAEVARENLGHIVRRAEHLGRMAWVDMEDSSYVDATLDLVRGARAGSDHVGVCLQAYLHRTPDDLDLLKEPPTRIRLVKGAYREPPAAAIQKKADVDRRFFDLALDMLAEDDYAARARPVLGTHDERLIARIQEWARDHDVPPDRLEFHLLYGIRADLQKRLAAAGHRVRVLISYGEHWYPWYVRRLAERPANLWFVAKQLVRR